MVERRGTLLAASYDKGQAVATQGSSSNSRLIAVGSVVLLFGVILVLLILRGTVGGDDPAPAAAEQDDGTTDAEGRPVQDSGSSDLVADGESSTARIPLPLEVEDGMEAVSVRAAFPRGVAALPTAGDRVVIYELGEAEEADDDEPGRPDAERVLEGVEVLGVVGPRPAANDGTLTFVLAVAEADVPGLLPSARDGHLWLTLQPGDGDEGEDGA